MGQPPPWHMSEHTVIRPRDPYAWRASPPPLAVQGGTDAPSNTVSVGHHCLGVHPHEFPPCLEDAPIYKDPLDVARLGVEDHLTHVVKAWRKVERLWIEHNDVGLLA